MTLILLLFCPSLQNSNTKSDQHRKRILATSGNCGDQLTWSLSNSNSHLTISGQGTMTNYLFKEDVPWFDHSQTISSITVESSVTSLGNWSFSSLPNLKSVSLPDTITTIGVHSFSFCTSLETISLPSNVETISSSAFEKCSKLTSISFGNRLTDIGPNCFSYCTSLERVTLPNTAIKLDIYSFYFCTSLVEMNFGSSLQEINSFALFNCSSLTSISFPDTLTTIGDFSFRYCSQIKSISIPSQVDYIGKSAFWHMTSLQSISVDSKNPNFKSSEGVLYNDDYSILIQYPTGKGTISYTTRSETTIIEEGSFISSQLTSIKINEGCTTIQNLVFSYSSIQKVELPSTLSELGSKSFYSCQNLNTLIFYGTTSPTFGEDVFDDCNQLKSVQVPDNFSDTSFNNLNIININETPKEGKKGISKAGIACAVIFTLLGVAIIVGVVIYFVKKNNGFFKFNDHSTSNSSLL